MLACVCLKTFYQIILRESGAKWQIEVLAVADAQTQLLEHFGDSMEHPFWLTCALPALYIVRKTLVGDMVGGVAPSHYSSFGR